MKLLAIHHVKCWEVHRQQVVAERRALSTALSGTSTIPPVGISTVVEGNLSDGETGKTEDT